MFARVTWCRGYKAVGVGVCDALIIMKLKELCNKRLRCKLSYIFELCVMLA